MCILACAAGVCAALSVDIFPLLKWPVLLASVLCPLLALLLFMRSRFAARLDISAAGEIILRRPALPRSRFLLGLRFHSHAAEIELHSVSVSLGENTTLWPGLMLLNLREDDGALHMLPILWDSVQPATFKALSVAFRWIAVREPSLGPQKDDFF